MLRFARKLPDDCMFVELAARATPSSPSSLQAPAKGVEVFGNPELLGPQNPCRPVILRSRFWVAPRVGLKLMHPATVARLGLASLLRGAMSKRFHELRVASDFFSVSFLGSSVGSGA